MQTIVAIEDQSVKIDVELNEKGCLELCTKLSKIAKGLPQRFHKFLTHCYAEFIFYWSDWMKHNGCIQGWEFNNLSEVLDRYDFTDVDLMVQVCTYIRGRYIEFNNSAKEIAEKFKEDFDFLPQYLRIHAVFQKIPTIKPAYPNS